MTISSEPKLKLGGLKMKNPFRKLREFLGIPESFTQPYSNGLAPIISGEIGQIDLYIEYNSYPSLREFFNVVKDGSQILELQVNKDKEKEYLAAKKIINEKIRKTILDKTI